MGCPSGRPRDCPLRRTLRRRANGGAIPALQTCAHTVPSLAGDGTWMGPFTSPRGKDRRLEGERSGSRSRRPGKPADGEAPAMAAESSTAKWLMATAELQQWGEAASRRAYRDRNRRQRGCRKATQGTPKVPGGPLEGPSSRSGRTCWGRRTTGPRVAHAAPAYPSHLASPRGPRGTDGACACSSNTSIETRRCLNRLSPSTKP